MQNFHLNLTIYAWLFNNKSNRVDNLKYSQMINPLNHNIFCLTRFCVHPASSEVTHSFILDVFLPQEHNEYLKAFNAFKENTIAT